MRRAHPKQLLRAALALLMLALGSQRAEALDEIQPFGGITWDDTLPVVITKLNKMDGIKTVVVAMAPFNASLAGLTTTSAATTAYEALDKKAREGSSPKLRESEFQARYPTFVVKGKDVHYWRNPITITAESVLIKGVLYRLIATFKSMRGLSLVNEKNVLWMPGEPKVAAPLVLTEVSLTPIGGREHLQEVWDVMNEKYHFAPTTSTVSTPKGSVQYNGGTIFYRYPKGYEATLENAYQESLSKAATAGKEDQSSKF